MYNQPRCCCGRRHDEDLSLTEAAAEAHVSERTVARLVASGRLPSALVGRTRRVRREDLLNHLNR